MAVSYSWKSIRTLLIEGFTVEELRRLCFDTTEFRPVFDQLSQNGSLADTVDHLLEYANQKLRVETLLAWAKEHNPARYEQHQPYVTSSTIDRASAPSFVNRELELDMLLQNLTNPAGEHFWLVSAPPQLGKTWLLQELVTQLTKRGGTQWTVKLVDLRSEPLETRIEASRLPSRFFGLQPNSALDQNAIIQCAAKISRAGQPWLCLLDSAELLEVTVTARLRQYLSLVYECLRRAGDPNIRLAFVAASRHRHRKWQGISPIPRFAHLTLTHFNTIVVERALRDKAERAKRTFSDDWYQENAERLCRVTEGLPALLVEYLQWIEDQGFIRPERVEEQLCFEELAKPYVRVVLLSADNLLPQGGERLAEKRVVLEKALLRLSPYRLFTQSHLKQIIESDPELKQALKKLEWTTDNLWNAISETNLMQPVDEPWRVLYPAVRRLLLRYYHPSPDTRADAHRLAGEFYQDWWNGVPAGKEQSVVLMERLWHQAEHLRLVGTPEITQKLIHFASDLFEKVISPRGFSLKELLIYIEEEMNKDDEFQETMEAIDQSLFGKLLEIAEQRREERK
jgi:hypothetical protein